MRALATLLVATMALLVPEPAASFAHAVCEDRGGRCSGCGCRGGPGYRDGDGKCVGHRELVRRCGPAPHAGCAFENAPGTGANRVCAKHKH